MQQPQATGVSPLKVFGKMLKFYRNRSGLTSDQLGAVVNLSGSAIRKVESGRQAPIEPLVDALEAVPGLRCDGALRALFDEMVEYLTNGVFPGWFQGWPKKEAAAARLRNFELVVFPGLVQTEDYARAVISTRVGLPRDKIDEEVAARLARQAIHDRDDPPVLWVIIDEGVLRRPIGSRKIMRDQLLHLRGLADRPNIVVQVIPLEAGAHQGLNGGAFVIAEFANARDVAYQDTAVSGQIIEDEDAIRELAHIWEALQRVTLPEALSLRVIEEAAEHHGHDLAQVQLQLGQRRQLHRSRHLAQVEPQHEQRRRLRRGGCRDRCHPCGQVSRRGRWRRPVARVARQVSRRRR
jgi:transcriptional regulator with XRE-family HTH domain